MDRRESVSFTSARVLRYVPLYMVERRSEAPVQKGMFWNLKPGYGVAADRAVRTMKERTDKEIQVRDHFIERILKEIPYVKLNGDRTKRLPNNVNVSFQFIEGESMLLMLDNYGICASSGSACTSGSLDPSHVLLAIGLPHEIAHGSLRMTLSEETTMEDADFVVDKLKEIVTHRSMSHYMKIL